MIIYKYLLDVGTNEIRMPAVSEILSVQNQNENIALWAVVDEGAREITRDILVVGTGHDISQELLLPYRFIGTVQTGQLVWHCFDITQ